MFFYRCAEKGNASVLSGLICTMILLSALFLLTSASNVSVDSIRVRKEVDWEKGVLSLNLSTPVVSAGERQPDGRYSAEMQIQEMMPDIFISSVLDLRIDSYYTLGDMLQRERNGLSGLKKVMIGGKKEYACLSEDLNNIIVSYSYPLYGEKGIACVFIRHERANPVRRILGFVPSRDYTGLVIYVKGEYMMHGKDSPGMLNPVLFPTLYDVNMNVILDKHTCDPGYLKRWGMALYTESLNEIPFTRRIGIDPLRTTANRIFGKHNGDIILPDDAVKKLTKRESNRRMLQECRILIIYEKEHGDGEPVLIQNE
ncbi:MAG: hypothetical protein JW881_02740 [Spirochaetales bacterium]|nr:hypothetical protein [Spirochaetales bacterium]